MPSLTSMKATAGATCVYTLAGERSPAAAVATFKTIGFGVGSGVGVPSASSASAFSPIGGKGDDHGARLVQRQNGSLPVADWRSVPEGTGRQAASVKAKMRKETV